MRYIDFHTHILPEMDDGAKTVADSLAMLKIAYECGAETVILTPHYHTSMSISEFCSKRDNRLALLEKSMKEDGGKFPKILCGAEVLVDGNLSEKPDLSKLCIQGTDLILLELPCAQWNGWHFHEIHRIIAENNLSPVMAHIERYMKGPQDLFQIDKLVSVGARFQVNAGSFLTFAGRRIIRALAAEGLICAIGSDCHGTSRRSPDMTRALRAFSKKFGEPFIDYLYKKTDKLLLEHSI